jgi:hypothetical protein
MTRRDLKSPFQVLDPGSADPGFWERFHRRVMASTGPELARRRLTPDLTVFEVLQSWGRAVVPVALMAAAAAGILLVQEDASLEPASMMTVEELLDASLGEPIPASLQPEDEHEISATLVSLERF